MADRSIRALGPDGMPHGIRSVLPDLTRYPPPSIQIPVDRTADVVSELVAMNNLLRGQLADSERREKRNLRWVWAGFAVAVLSMVGTFAAIFVS